MKALFLNLTAKFDALAVRERRLLAAALLGGTVLLSWSLFIDPALTKTRSAGRFQIEQQAQLTALNAQMAALNSPAQNPDTQALAELESLKKEIAALGEQFSALEASLVPPQRMSSLLEDMIGRRSSLRLISLRTLPVTPVLDKKEGADVPGAARPAAGLYKHGVEIRLEGSYAELADYLARLEKSPQKLLWSNLVLAADKHPKLVLTLTVYTLSLDRTWLIV